MSISRIRAMIILGSIRCCMTVPVVFIMTGLHGYVMSIPKCDTYLQNFSFLIEFPQMDTGYGKETDYLYLHVYFLSESSRGQQTTECWYGCKKAFPQFSVMPRIPPSSICMPMCSPITSKPAWKNTQLLRHKF